MEAHLVLVFNQAGGGLEVRLDHLLDKRIEIDTTLPAQNSLGFGRVSVKKARNANVSTMVKSYL